MGRVLQPFLIYLSVAQDRELARHVQFLREQLRIVHSRLTEPIRVTPQERRRLLKFGRGLKRSVLQELLTVVHPRTFARWLSGERSSKSKTEPEVRKPGRPKTAAEIRDLVIRLAQETGWGSKKIAGELEKLGVELSRSAIGKILHDNGFDSGLERSHGTWKEFTRRHAETLWACDFFSKKVWTSAGLVDVFVLFFIHVGSRRVHIAGMTTNPNEAWVEQQARNMSMLFAEEKVPPRYLIMDMDTKFTKKCRETLETDGLEILRVGPRRPILNAYAERFVQSIKTECLDHFVCFGIDHLNYIVNRYKTYYNRLRPHQGLGNRTLPVAAGEEPTANQFSTGRVECQKDLGGLLKHYYRRAA